MNEDRGRREVLTELDNEWHTLKHGNPIPSLYPQTGAETVRVRGESQIHGDKTYTRYEIIVSDRGRVVGRYTVVAEEDLSSLSPESD